MSDNDDRLAAQLREYYAQLTSQPAPDMTRQVMTAADTRAALVRRLIAVGGGLAVAAAAAAVVVLALVNHAAPTRGTPATSPTPAPNPTQSVAPTQAPAPVIPVGPPVQGFIPSDVTAVSAGQWWVLGYDGPSCSSASCTRILHTTDGGQSFASIPVPPVAPAQGGQQAVRLRFADPSNGWVVSATGSVWATHDGGSRWSQDDAARSVTDLEASGGAVYAVRCVGSPVPAQSCTLERSPSNQDSWSLLPASSGHGSLGRLNVNGAHVWVAIYSPAGGPGSVLASTDSGQHFSTQTACPSALGFANIYAVDTSVLWATCATGTQATTLRSVDGGQHFVGVAHPGIANFASIAGVSSTTAVIGAQALFRTVDGGKTYGTVEDNQTQWSVVGFTTSNNGFVFDLEASGQRALWRTNDAGAQWYKVQFP
jgi:photosystem II stability/assembly factor-like uncharacterized protein